ncbi:MAG: AraC family transcriptional regulator [Thermoanaerobaculia bacterium]|nr:AraC family transcriptional regulator [Thermoanaerobaculia bacterium]
MPETFTLHTTRYAPRERHAPHWHGELQLSLLLGGSLTEFAGGQQETATTLSVAVKDAGVVHGDEFGPAGALIARLDLPAGSLANLLDDPRRGSSWRWHHDPAVAGPFLRLVARGDHGTFTLDDPDIVDLLAGLSTRPLAGSGAPPRWLDQLRRRLEAEWEPGLSVATVASWARVHPVYLARCFRRFYGQGVAEHLRWLRLRHATTDLFAARNDVAAVAHEAGFADEAHFSRTFRAWTSLAPSRFRKHLGRLPMSPSPAPRG